MHVPLWWFRFVTPAASDPQTPARLSFAEVMQLVQEGKEVPGLTKPDIKPSNRSPTPSQMKQVPKPWETLVFKVMTCRCFLNLHTRTEMGRNIIAPLPSISRRFEAKEEESVTQR
uniref:Peroxisomal membrane protein PEX14-like KPWE domain-containing protein n=1 Tax=Kryptolebias marmoratus TaxID=37003 RepID=A0A3Q2ZST0_KRYMA